LVHTAEAPAQDPVLLAAFRTWMREQRGTGDLTLNCYSIPLRDLLKRIGEDPGRLDAQTLRQFVLERSLTCGPGAAKNCTAAPRMARRSLSGEGMCATGLARPVPVVAHWRFSSLPRSLHPEQVQRILAPCTPATPVGKRDRAIVLLLARLGLRAGDI